MHFKLTTITTLNHIKLKKKYFFYFLNLDKIEFDSLAQF